MDGRIAKALGNDGSDFDYDSKAKSDCIRQSIYCVASIALFIAAFLLGDPNLVAALPGGAVTGALISIAIFIGVLFLCRWQMK
ncbi:MAG: hypothetical protein ACFFEF_18020 [Candidatus Thorarchaeota archaeon]